MGHIHTNNSAMTPQTSPNFLYYESLLPAVATGFLASPILCSASVSQTQRKPQLPSQEAQLTKIPGFRKHNLGMILILAQGFQAALPF